MKNPIKHLLEIVNSQSARTVIALAGIPGAGKSTIAQKWALAVNRLTSSNAMQILGMDGFHLTKAQLKQMADPKAALARRGAPWTFDPSGFAHKLRALKSRANKNPIYWPGFEHEVGDPVDDAITIPVSCRLVVVEGLYLLYREDDWQSLAGCFAETWYLDTPLDIAMSRLIKRHQQAWHMSEAEAKRRVETNDQQNALIVLSTRDQADWIIPDEAG